MSEFSNASSLTQQGSMGAGDGPSIRGVKGPSRISDADPDAFIDGGGGQIAEREPRSPPPSPRNSGWVPRIPDGHLRRSSPPARRPGGCPRRPAEDVRRGRRRRRRCGRARCRRARCRAPAAPSALGRFPAPRISDFPTAPRRRRRRRRARLLRAETGARRRTDRARTRVASSARGAGIRATRAPAAGAAAGRQQQRRERWRLGALAGKGQQQQSRGALSPLDHTRVPPRSAHRREAAAHRGPGWRGRGGLDGARLPILAHPGG